LTSFLWREREVAGVTGQLSETRLITLHGLGACGKVRLTLEVASEVAKSFEGVVGMAGPLSDTELVPQAVASVLDVLEAPGRSPIETLADHLETSRALPILDNCEHLVEACAVLTDALLRSCQNLHVLATSREALGVGGEVSWSCPRLSLPEPRRLLSEERLPD
jgi:non-specific serine/threonine protein kinase